MAFLRPIALLIVFFAGLYILRGPVSQTGPNLDVLVVKPFEAFLEALPGKISTVPNYSPLPGFGGSADVVPPDMSASGTGMNASTSVKADAATTSFLKYVPSLSSGAELVTIKTSGNAPLSAGDVISLTNAERQKAGAGALAENPKLDASAEVKLKDMFARQYFEHVSPSGVAVSDLAQAAGYEYIVIGENLALGNFGGDANLIAAWMASPGHRANILDPRFTDIGVAVGQGIYQGQEVWMAVQHFGKPLSACPGPSDAQKQQINDDRIFLQNEETQITTLKATLDQQQGNAYVSDVNQYNGLVEDYNSRLAQFQTTVDQYNQSVKDFNSCAGLN